MTGAVTYQILSDAPDPELIDRCRRIPVEKRPSCLVFLNADDSHYYNGRLSNELYSVRFGRQTPMLIHRIADFLRYETKLGRSTLIYSEYRCDIEGMIRQAIAVTPDPSLRREYDPSVLVHSTTDDRLECIRSSGAILPSSMLRQSQHTMRLVGFEDLGEPPEYIDFVHFAELGSATGEVIVLSHRDGRINTDFDAEYTPGARIYLSFDSLLADGKLWRDGLHVVKALGPVALARYSIETITWRDFPNSATPWTPRSFATAADTEFVLRHPELGREGSA